MTLILCPRGHVETVCKSWAPSHLISLLSPGGDAPVAVGPGAKRLDLAFNDIAAPTEGLVAPDEAAIARILSFGADWAGDAPLLVYCWAGISRSPAAAFALACQRHPEIAEETIAASLRRTAPWATPNPFIVQIADDLLGRDGRMARAIRAIGRGAEAFEGAPVSFTMGAPSRL